MRKVTFLLLYVIMNFCLNGCESKREMDIPAETSVEIENEATAETESESITYETIAMNDDGSNVITEAVEEILPITATTETAYFEDKERDVAVQKPDEKELEVYEESELINEIIESSDKNVLTENNTQNGQSESEGISPNTENMTDKA